MTRGTRSRWRRLALVLALAAALGTGLGGCLDANVPSAAPTTVPSPEPTPVTTTYQLGTQVWYAGLVVTVDRVTATLDARGGIVEVLVGVANPSADAAELNAAFTLLAGGTRVEPTRDSRVPEVPGSGSVAAVLTFELQRIPSVDDAILEIGTSPAHLGRVPLTPRAGTAVSFKPVELNLGGTATASSLKVTLQGGLLRWDLPDWSQELDASLQALTLTYDVTYAGDFAGGLAFTGENVALRLPDGTVISARRDGHSQSVELVGARKTKKGLFSRFEIPAGLTGSFALVIKNAGTTKTIAFAIGG
ncbi:MAG: hypothetical protein HYX55_11410 [Chloroflexi bacterium]|nr:hypothetical protein [Chloroflexota bacterium]